MNNFITTYLKLEPQENSSLRMILLICLAYLFGVLIRFILYYQVAPIESFWLDGSPLPIYSPDAGLYGYYAKQLLAGASYPMDAEHMPGYLIYWIVGIFSMNIDWVMFLLPAFLAPLIVIPIILIGYSYHQTTLGFFAALIGVIGINFYTRSYIGYMDTDTLNLFFPYMAIASFMMALSRRNLLWGILGIFSLVAFYFWYHSSIVIIAAILAMLLIVTPLTLRSKRMGILSLILIIVGLFFVSPEKITQRASAYFETTPTITLKTKNQDYNFVNTLESVAEAQQVSVFSAHEQYIGTTPYVILASIGFILLSLMQPLFLMALPMIILAYSSSYTGMRFTMFATPIFALGFVGLSFIIAHNLSHYKKTLRYSSIAFSLVIIFLMIANIVRVNPSFTPSYFLQNDVKALSDFAKQSKQKDLLISWWDYGWPLWYYTGRNNTLVDNGRHGADTHLIAKILLSKDNVFIANTLAYFANKQEGNSPILPRLIHKEDIQKRFNTLQTETHKRKKDRDIYILLHRDMLLTFATFENFAHIDINNGNKTADNSQFYISTLLRPYSKKERIIKGDTFNFDLANGMIKGHDGASTQIQGVIIVDKGKITAAKRYNPRSPMSLIIYNKTKAIYLDHKALNSFLIKALLFDQYDTARFEKVTETSTFKILKLK
ncbi:MAG: STT3 domain-containing protein [Campylobacterota bacterium]|nr:STT3 domain-containing protein [Campylobacterota bacterium]